MASKKHVATGFILLTITWVVSVYHLSVFPAPIFDTRAATATGQPDRWLPRSEHGLNHLILSGHPYKRGQAVGRLTKHLLDLEEDYLVAEMERFFPNDLLRHTLLFGVRRFYWGIEPWFPDWAVHEMFGVSEFSTDKYNYYADPLTRQIAYHGVHELGQMFVDFEKGDFGCTLMATPHQGGWVVGRNFDFEAVRILDTEKILKWVFPDDGYAHVAVTWAGMVGAVTGVNEHGVYVSINAAGSADFRRYGTPSTLVLVDALQRARTSEEAVKIIETAEVFITDLFVVTDVKGSFFRIEKTPDRVRSMQMTGPTAVANHLTHPDFVDDGVNKFRREEQTTSYRGQRAEALVNGVPEGLTDTELEDLMLTMLRDKNNTDGTPLHLGNRRALDALIATHSVIYNSTAGRLFVSKGPALTGGYNGYDLKRSFAERTPILVRTLPEDGTVSEDFFFQFKSQLAKLIYAKTHMHEGSCDLALSILKPLESELSDHTEYLQALGDTYKCLGRDDIARTYWQRSLHAVPAYAKHEQYLKGRLQ
jgi:isopenicillin-N N-acyltransferase-like protein